MTDTGLNTSRLTAGDQQLIAAAIRDAEANDKDKEQHVDKLLCLIELCLLPIAAFVTVLVPISAAPLVYLPNAILRSFQFILMYSSHRKI